LKCKPDTARTLQLGKHRYLVRGRLLARKLEVCRVLVVGSFGERNLPPEVGGDELVGNRDRNKGGLQEVTHGRSASLGLCIHILNASELQETLGRRRSDDTSTTRRRDQTAHDRTDLAANFGWYSVWLTKRSTPVTPSDRDDAQLGRDNGAPDSGCDFLGALDAESDMPVEITDGDERLESCALAGTGLLLDRHDLHDFVLESGEEEVDNLVLFDREREEIDLLHRLDLAVLDKAA